jgi:hypothetical protein
VRPLRTYHYAHLYIDGDDDGRRPLYRRDERARDARRAGLEAKKDEQPLNTTRSYASKQREWKARLSPPPPFSLT